MTWQLSSLNWPHTAASIQTQAESVNAQVGNAAAQAMGQLNAVVGKVTFQRHPLSAEAEALVSLRAELDALQQSGTVLTVSPYMHQIGSALQSGHYLNPQQAVNHLAGKMRDQVDVHRPTGVLYGLAIMLTANQLSAFAKQLTDLTAVLNLTDWCQVARFTTALTTNEQTKLHQPAPIVQPRFKTAAALNAQPLRAASTAMGTQLATLESLADDKITVIGKLATLATKRAQRMAGVSDQLNALKSLQGSVWSMSLSGNPHSMATMLAASVVPGNHPYTIASLMLSNEPLTFFEELLC
ncbi:hypothetical protein [Photobacterium halotolerans]|uniref:Uncharacterized protein n=1 Tax=Photobacterium halotolerans TaxID=265726 RepID=A0A0F5VH41_9GAMM|nr:hypothetical protein [Photobacterium halotolerans]KKD01378.1 hypothetical protein KY46_00660 [Photobacterium halotolerans]